MEVHPGTSGLDLDVLGGRLQCEAWVSLMEGYALLDATKDVG